ncbi:MAG TPA: thioredoxin family protein [Thermoanaerobaculia bacterium]|jgi:thiol:disulfide interchange protein
MARTDQRSLPVILFVIAAALLAARFIAQYRTGDGVQWMSVEQGLQLAQTSNKPILLDFTADWCAPCHQLDKEVFQDAKLAKTINERFIPIRVVDRQQEEGRNSDDVGALQRQFGVRAFPTVVIADKSGSERARMEGFGGRAKFEQMMESVR